MNSKKTKGLEHIIHNKHGNNVHLEKIIKSGKIIQYLLGNFKRIIDLKEAMLKRYAIHIRNSITEIIVGKYFPNLENETSTHVKETFRTPNGYNQKQAFP